MNKTIDQLPQHSLVRWLAGSMAQHTPEELQPMMREAGFTEIETGQTRFKLIAFVRGRVRGI